jgi:hypothetical protein
MVELKHNDIIVWKGVEWFKLLKLDKYNLSRALIQFGTLSRYTHTAIYLKYFEKEYILQSNLKTGIHIIEVTEETWFKSNIEENVYDLYRFKVDVVDLNSFQRTIQSLLGKMYSMGEKKASIGSYSVKGILNQAIYNLTGKSPLIKKSNVESMFCSELSYYYFTIFENSFLIAPYNLTDSDFFRKVK